MCSQVFCNVSNIKFCRTIFLCNKAKICYCIFTQKSLNIASYLKTLPLFNIIKSVYFEFIAVRR